MHRLALAFLLTASLTLVLRAQSTNASLTGRIADPAKALVVDAKVSAVRAEFFNIFNHPNFGNPVNTLPSPLFGRSTQTLASSLGSGGANGGLNPLYQIGGPRSVQFALKLQF